MNAGITPAHWIRPNEANRVPRRHVIIDTEAHQAETVRAKVQTFRLACAAFDHQTKAGRDWRPTERERFTDPRALWEWVDGCTIPGRRLVVVAHNLAYDLRIAEAFAILPALGWRLDIVRLDGGSAWCQWRRESRSMVCVDTVSWFGASLEKVGAALRMTKPALPSFDDTDDAWFERCAGDVEILRCAWRRVIDWIDGCNVGNWKPTGAGQGWAFLRHRHLTHRILHHGVERIAKIERGASYTGRCEAWRWGELENGPFTEWDFASAYAQVCEEMSLPVRLVGRVGPKAALNRLCADESVATLLRCKVDTPAPVVPHRRSDGILWPTGRFESWLWDVEARGVIDAGGSLDVVEGYRYATAPALRQWASWILDALAAPARELDPLLRMIVKGWSRTTVGRFGAQWSTWDDVGEAHGVDVSLHQAEHRETARRFRMMMIGGRCIAEGERGDAPDSAVHVMSFVMAACRVKLWRAMQTAGLDHVAYVDTDGLFVDKAGELALIDAALPGLRPKSRWSTVEVLGPRQLILDGRLRCAGVPASAVRVGPRSWSAEIWRSLPASMRAGELDRVTITDRRFELRGVDRRRVHLAGGSTAAVELSELV